MKDEIIISENIPDLNEEDLKAADKRRDEYALVRDLQAKEDNEAIERRLAKDKQSQGYRQKAVQI